MHLDNALDDRQPEAGTRLFPGAGTIGLLERLSNELVLSPSNFEKELLDKACCEAKALLGEERFAALAEEGKTLSLVAASPHHAFSIDTM